ncbi:hypothetical protein ACHAPU_009281 [Fusarium lateritium]
MWNVLDSREAASVKSYLGPARTGELFSLADILEYKIINSLILQLERAQEQSLDQTIVPDHSQTPQESTDHTLEQPPTYGSQRSSSYDATHKPSYSINKETDISADRISSSHQNTNTEVRQTATDDEMEVSKAEYSQSSQQTSHQDSGSEGSTHSKHVQQEQDVVEISQAKFLSSQTSSRASSTSRRRDQGRKLSPDSCQKCRRDKKKCTRGIKGTCERCYNAGTECLAGKLDGRTKAARVEKRKSQ